MKKQTFHVKDIRNDDFATTVKEDSIRPLPKNYKYINDTWYERFADFIIYKSICKFIGILGMKFSRHYKIINGNALKHMDDGAFLYINHTMKVGDAFMPCLLGQKKNYVIVGSQAASLTWLLPVMRVVGSLPLSNDLRQFISMRKAIEERVNTKGNTVTIYPEAHVWPYYTGIRKYSNASFKYPAMMNKKIYVVTNCYQKMRFSDKPKLITVIDGPFSPDPSLSVTDNSIMLRDIAYETMVKRAKEYSTYSYNEYVFDCEEKD